MFENMKYCNHKGECIESVKDNIYANYHELRDYSWEYETNANRIIRFNRGIKEKSIPLIICCDSEESGTALKNRLMEIAEKDVLAKQPGKIWIDGYYLKGYVTESKKSAFLIDKRYMEITLTLLTDDPVWRKETEYHFLPEDISQEDSTETLPETTAEISALDNGAVIGEFPFDVKQRGSTKIGLPLFDVPFDFRRIVGQRVINNDSFVASDFIMTIYGFVDTPRVLISGHPYQIDALVYEGERIIIDSAAGTVVKIGRLGEQTNLYNSRAKENSVFEKIQPGYQMLSWPGTFGVDLVLFDERSEPKWSL